MTDFHVHFGQFKDAYYYPEKVVQDLATRGIDHAWISSTTSCMYCSEQHPEFAGQPAARQIEDSVTDEFRAAISEGSKCGVKIHPLYWLVPDFEKSGVRFEDYLPSVPYEGFKIHPRAQNWDLSDDRIRSLAERAFTDRQSTRLHSSHQIISYAVFCLKKKKEKRHGATATIKDERARSRKSTVLG